MGGEQWVGAGAPPAVTHLQPGNSTANAQAANPFDTDASFDAALAATIFTPGALKALLRAERITGKEAAEVEAAAVSLLRRAKDAILVEQLAAAGFAGPKYEVFEAELVAYALPILRSWLRRGLIFEYCMQRGRPVTVNAMDRAYLAENLEERLGLAGETIARALPVFREHALIQGGWTQEGGASLPTYFVGATLNEFPNVFRKWRGERDAWRHAHGYGLNADDLGGQPFGTDGEDPGESVVSRQFVVDTLSGMPDNLREVAVRMVLGDESQAEAGEAAGLTERAVEGRLHRYRNERARRRDERRNS
ncbi:hypothetical protein ACIA8G_35105 [Lentzea sp. NPDC051213]|uniref:hypothetical protein n=1 Tax=Lentzea sp. NPDC051213 TaxID=3364126 RepID=UPI0037AA3FBD